MDAIRCLVLLVFLVLAVLGLAMLIFYSGRKPTSSTTSDEKGVSHITPKYTYTSKEKDTERKLRNDYDDEMKDDKNISSEIEKELEFTRVSEEEEQQPQDEENKNKENEEKEKQESKEEDDEINITLILDKIEENSSSWSYEIEGKTIDVTKKDNVSSGMSIFVHSRRSGTFTLEDVKFGGNVYPVPRHEKVLSVHTYGFKVDPSFVYYILVVDKNSVSRVYKNDGEKFNVDLGTHDFRKSMERMAVRLGRKFDKLRLFSLTALGNFEFGVDEINVTRYKISEKYIALIISNIYGNIIADGFTINGKDQHGLPAGKPYYSIVVYYQVDSNTPLLVKFVESGEVDVGVFYRNDLSDSWTLAKFLDLEKQLDHLSSFMTVSSRLDYYIDLFTRKEQIKIDVDPDVDNNTYSLLLIDKIKLTSTTYMFVFEYDEYLKRMVEVPMLSSLRFIGFHDEPKVPGYWNHVKIDELDNEVVRYYTPIYIDAEKRKIHFLVRLYLPNDMFPDGGRFTRYLDKLCMNKPLRIQTTPAKYRFISDDSFDDRDKIVQFDTLNLVAGGTGVTPFIRLLNYYQDLPFNINMVVCSESSEQVVLKQLFDKFAKINYRLHVTYLIMDEDNVPEGMVTANPKEVFASQFEKTDKALTLVCGQLTFGDLIIGILKALDFKNIYYL